MTCLRICFALLLAQFLAAPHLFGGSKVTAHVIYMVPYQNAAKEVSRPGWGLGGDFVLGLPGAKDVLTGVAGLEFVNLMSRSYDAEAFVDGAYVNYTKSTDQWYGRIHLGGQIGGLGRGFFRPYLGLNAALVFYAINTHLDFHPRFAPDYTENVYDDIDAVFGYDVTAGLDLNIWERISLDGGVKYLKSFSVPDQLGGGSDKIYPQYFQVYLGVGIDLFAGAEE